MREYIAWGRVTKASKVTAWGQGLERAFKAGQDSERARIEVAVKRMRSAESMFDWPLFDRVLRVVRRVAPKRA
jgi:hypothetical protein